MRLQTGTLVAKRYRVDKLVGEGGLAEVYKVWDTLRATPVALKLLRSEWATRSLILEKFHTEADVLSRLQHPNIVRFYEFVQHQDLVFIIMDYVEGHTLRDEIRSTDGGMSPEKILAILQPVCTALHYAHSQGVIHCDVKPENILIDNLGQVRLMDFGIAHILERGMDEILGAGTAAYMAPEQILGKAILPQTDQYAIGIILFELLCGQKPFQGRNSQRSISERIRWEQINAEPPFLKQINPAIQPGWDEIIQRSLKKDYRLRYPSIMDFLYAIDEQTRYLSRPSGVVNPTIIQKPLIVPNESFQKIKKKMIGVGGFGTIVVIIILIILLTINHSGSQSSIPTTVIPKTYPYSQNCMVIVVQEQPKVELHECITSITVQPDGKLMVNMEWKTVSQSSSYGVSVQADKNNDHMYLTDDLGNRLDHVATGGGTNQSAKLYDGQSKQGWFLFPKPDQSATVFYFVDEDNGVTSPALDRLWP